jgi:hypothetical protein
VCRNNGWKDAEAAVAWNQRVLDRPCVAQECKIDVTNKTPSAVFDEVFNGLGEGFPDRLPPDSLPDQLAGI